MKLKNLIPQRFRRQLIRQFGAAKLIRHANGKYELIGGSASDRANAADCASLFDHEIVFTQ